MKTRKIVRNLLIVAMVLLLAVGGTISAFADNYKKAKLATPKPEWDSSHVGTITWKAVANAYSYVIRLSANGHVLHSGSVMEDGSASYSADLTYWLMYTGYNKYTVLIQATSRYEDVYISSDWGESSPFTGSISGYYPYYYGYNCNGSKYNPYYPYYQYYGSTTTTTTTPVVQYPYYYTDPTTGVQYPYYYTDPTTGVQYPYYYSQNTVTNQYPCYYYDPSYSTQYPGYFYYYTNGAEVPAYYYYPYCGNYLAYLYSHNTRITLDRTSVSGAINDSISLSAAVVSPYQPSLSWSSSNTDVATVDQAGNVKLIADGTAIITVTDPSAGSATCTVTVSKTAHIFKVHVLH